MGTSNNWPANQTLTVYFHSQTGSYLDRIIFGQEVDTNLYRLGQRHIGRVHRSKGMRRSDYIRRCHSHVVPYQKGYLSLFLHLAHHAALHGY